MPRESATVVHIDIDAEEIGRNHRSSIPLQSDARLAAWPPCWSRSARAGPADWDLDELAARGRAGAGTPRTTSSRWRATDQAPADHSRAGRAPDDDDLIVTDASLSSGWAATSGAPLHRATVACPRGLAGLGWGLPAAIGAAFALLDDRLPGGVLCLAGDGGWAYSFGEIETLTGLDAG